MRMDLIADLSERGLIHDSTDLEFLQEPVGLQPFADAVAAGVG